MRLAGSQITLHKLEVFCAVAELSSISRAAERLGIAQPVVTVHVRLLQDKLGVRLLARRGRNIALTDEGHRAYRWAKDVVVRTKELEREFVDGPRAPGGHVSIASSLTVGSYVLPIHLSRYRKANPLTLLSLKVTTPRECVEAVMEGECDIGVTLLAPNQHTDGLDVALLCNERMVLVAAPASEHVGTAAANAEISLLPFVAAERGAPRRDIEESALRPLGIVRNRIELEISHAEGMKEAVIDDAGVAFLFEASVRRELMHGELRLVATPDLDIFATVYLVTRRGKVLSPVQRRVRDHLAEVLRR